MKRKIKLGVIGVGGRCAGILEEGWEQAEEVQISKGALMRNFMLMDDVEIVAVCDVYEDRMRHAQRGIKTATGKDILGTLDYKEVLAVKDMDAVLIATSWEMHIPIAIDAMKAGKMVALEVGGAYCIEDCWNLVRTSEETGVPCMLLENCCYTRNELLVYNMVKMGLFGEIVHCTGGYHHDLRWEIIPGNEKRHYRLRNYLMRNCDNYPTHELGPICKLLDINRGNRIVSLSSVASKSAGLRDYAKRMYGDDHELANATYVQGDIVTTMLKCAGGETILLQLDTCLPRPFYSRNYSVRGTLGMYNEETRSIRLDGEANGIESYHKTRDNLDEFYEKYDHPIWKEYSKNDIPAGHGGADWLVCRAFVESAKRGTQPPIDVYDTALWMSIGALTESSIARGGMPVDVPDFTRGKWTLQRPIVEGKYCLDKVCEDKSVKIY